MASATKKNHGILNSQRIILVFPTLDLGGAERQGLLLADDLRRRCGARPAITALFGGTGAQAVRRICRELRLPCLRFSMPEMIDQHSPTAASVRQFARELRFLAPDILLPYTLLPNVLCGLTWRRAGATTCVWGQRDAGVGGDSRWRSRAMDAVPVFAANSSASVDYLELACGIAPERIVRIANGVSPAPPRESRSVWRAKLGLASDMPAVCMLANVHPLKDHRTLILAWKQVLADRRCEKAMLLLAGQLSHGAAELQALARQLGLDARIRWLGPVEDVSGLLGAMDLAVLSSRSEGLSNALLESMAAGLPIVASDIAGVREALPEQQLSHLATPGDATDLAGKIIHLLADENARTHLGRANREWVAKAFSVSRMGDAFAALLAGQLSKGPSRKNPRHKIAPLYR